MKMGKHSKSPRLQSLLASVNRSNIQFFHSSAKAGEHLVPDKLSRLNKPCGVKDCQVERFLDDVPAEVQCMSVSINSGSPNMYDLIFGNLSLASTTAELSDILSKGRGPYHLEAEQLG